VRRRKLLCRSKSITKPWCAASSDFHISIEEQIAQGDKVVTWIIGSGTHHRERFYGFGPYRSSYDDEAHSRRFGE
jgi:hypothetical protein